MKFGESQPDSILNVKFPISELDGVQQKKMTETNILRENMEN